MFPDVIKNFIFIFIGILGIGFLIGFHELGHFLFAKLFKVSTPSFSIGMGPKLLNKKIGETTFSISALPLGGFVEIAGMPEVGQGEQKEAKRKDKYSFSVKPYYQKLLILSGGIIFNLILAYVIFIFLFMTGMPKTPILYPEDVSAVIGNVSPGSAAEKFNLKSNDKIVAINKIPVNNVIEVSKKIQELPEQKAIFTIERDGSQQDIEVQVGYKEVDQQKIGMLGVDWAPGEIKYLPQYSIVESVKHGISSTNKIICLTFSAFGSMFKQKKFEGIGGPLLVISETIKGIKKGFKIFLILLAFISINLAILNLIPLPIMDGGQILFTTIEAIIRKQIPENIRLVIHYICWIGIILLAIYLSVADIRRIFFK